jgi:hypothetical protein
MHLRGSMIAHKNASIEGLPKSHRLRNVLSAESDSVFKPMYEVNLIYVAALTRFGGFR